MAAMGMTLRVVVPPHPLIGHWLTVLRDRHTPAPLYGSALAELGRWLSYEALRDWLPQRSVSLETSQGQAEGQVVDPDVPLLALPLLRAGLGLWQGAQAVLPQASVAHLLAAPGGPDGTASLLLDPLPAHLPERLGVLVFTAQLSDGADLVAALERLEAAGVSGERLRVISGLCASPGLKRVGDRFPWLTIYTACIDAELAADGAIVPGIGAPALRLFGELGTAQGGAGGTGWASAAAAS